MKFLQRVFRDSFPLAQNSGLCERNDCETLITLFRISSTSVTTSMLLYRAVKHESHLVPRTHTVLQTTVLCRNLVRTKWLHHCQVNAGSPSDLPLTSDFLALLSMRKWLTISRFLFLISETYWNDLTNMKMDIKCAVRYIWCLLDRTPLW